VRLDIHPRTWHNRTLASRFTVAKDASGPGGTLREIMKKDIHPEYVATTVTCTCGNTFDTKSTVTSGAIHVEVCSACHPFYTGKQKIMDTGGRVARFEKRYGNKK